MNKDSSQVSLKFSTGRQPSREVKNKRVGDSGPDAQPLSSSSASLSSSRRLLGNRGMNRGGAWKAHGPAGGVVHGAPASDDGFSPAAAACCLLPVSTCAGFYLPCSNLYPYWFQLVGSVSD